MLTHQNLDDLKYYVLRELPSVLEQEPRVHYGLVITVSDISIANSRNETPHLS